MVTSNTQVLKHPVSWGVLYSCTGIFTRKAGNYTRLRVFLIGFLYYPRNFLDLTTSNLTMTSNNNNNKVFLEIIEKTLPQAEEQTPSIEIRFGAVCPKCLKGIFDYDGLLNLVCPHCGFTAGGCFT